MGRKLEYEVPDLTNLTGICTGVLEQHRDDLAREINRMERKLKHLRNQKELLCNIIELRDACESMNEEIKEYENQK
jgi:phage shock protein A